MVPSIRFSGRDCRHADKIFAFPARTEFSHRGDVAALLNVSERQVYKLASEGRIPCFRIGGSVRFVPSAFASWLRQKIGPVSVDAQGRARVRRP
jgi:excisionase family DNA binding protein